MEELKEGPKEISIDCKIIDLRKFPKLSNQIQKNKLILVEGSDDLYFFNYYLKFLEIKNIEIRCIGCKFGFNELSTFMKILNNFNLLESLGLVCDADDNFAEEEFKRLSGIINEINKKDPIPGINLLSPSDKGSFSTGNPRIGIFVFPNNEKKGRLEDLFLSCVNDKPEMKCVNPFMDCVLKLKNSPRIQSKAKALAYLATQKETRRGVGGAAREKIWEFKSNELNGVKAFIENL